MPDLFFEEFWLKAKLLPDKSYDKHYFWWVHVLSQTILPKTHHCCYSKCSASMTLMVWIITHTLSLLPPQPFSIQHTQTHPINVGSHSFTVCVTSCIICDDIVIYYGRVYMGKVEYIRSDIYGAGWILKD